MPQENASNAALLECGVKAMGTLLFIVWENGEGQMVASIGWEVCRCADTVTIAAQFVRHNNFETITENVTEIPVANIHSEMTFAGATRL